MRLLGLNNRQKSALNSYPLLMYARRALAQPVWSDFWRPRLISQMCTRVCAFIHIHPASDFSPIDVCNWFRRFSNSCRKQMKNINDSSRGEQKTGGEIWGGAPRRHLRKCRFASAAAFYKCYFIILQRRGGRKGRSQPLCCSSFTSKLHI